MCLSEANFIIFFFVIPSIHFFLSSDISYSNMLDFLDATHYHRISVIFSTPALLFWEISLIPTEFILTIIISKWPPLLSGIPF